MKWLLLTCFLLWARHGEGGALKCLSGDDECLSQMSEEKEHQEIDIRRPSGSTDAPFECLPGSEWDSNCHRCRCLDGEAQCLRLPGCETIDEPIRCAPNSTFDRECNTCVCLESGLGLCTVEPCGRIPTESTESSVPSKVNIVKGVDCAPGTAWQSQCNDCVCSPDGFRRCTERACPGQESEPLLRCAPQSQWKNDCNMCWCNSGRAMCTKMGCAGISVEMFGEGETSDSEELPEPNETVSRKTRATPQEERKNCLPGQNFRLDCNQCLCDTTGLDFSCTRIDCAALNNNNNNGARRKRDVSDQKVSTDCMPGSVFDQACNVCRCTADGRHASCTLKRCPGKENSTLTATESSFRCNPGEQFKQSCNDCSCSADGKSVFCTLRVCDEDLAP